MSESKSKRKKKLPDNYYVSPEEMTEIILKYQDDVRAAKAASKPIPPQPDSIGKIILQIIDRVSSRYSYRGYTWLEEMKSDAIIACVRCVMGYDPDKGSPFSYMSMAAQYAFWGRTSKEKNIHARKIEDVFDPTTVSFDVNDLDRDQLGKWSMSTHELAEFYYQGKSNEGASE